MVLAPGIRLRLDPTDEFMHPVEEARNFNESVYANLYDREKRVGGWFRIGNRPNEGYAEISVCVYLPDGSVAFTFGRPEISSNERFDAGGFAYHVAEPFKRVGLRYQGKILLLKDPSEMADPRRAFTSNPLVDADLAIEYRGVSPMYGGEQVNADGTPITERPEESFARGHFEQHIAGAGHIKIAGTRHEVSGLGLRDHSWGPRYWQNLHWYRWLPMNFTEDFAAVVSIVTMADGKQRIGGVVLRDGRYEPIREARIASTYDARHYQTALVADVTTPERDYRIEGRVLSLIPLRNRRTAPDGTKLRTRITEGLTEYRCDGHVGYGLSEYLDQIEGGRPVGLPA